MYIYIYTHTHIWYNLLHFRIGVGNDPTSTLRHIWFRRNRTRGNAYSIYLMVLFIRLLPYAGFCHENHLYWSVRAGLRTIGPIWRNRAPRLRVALLSWGLRALVIFKITQSGTSQSFRTDLVFKFWDNGRFSWTKREENVIRYGVF